MPPKPASPAAAPKGGAKGKGGKKGAEKAPEPLTPEQQALADLEATKTLLEQEQKDRNFMQLERDKLQQFWDVSKQQLEDAGAELRQRDRESEEQIERHEVELKAFKQKIKHLLYEHGHHIEQLKADADAAVKVAAEEFHVRESLLLADKRALQTQLRELEAEYQTTTHAALLDSGKRESKLRAELVSEAGALAAKHERQLAAAREAANLQRKQEQHAIEERSHAHIQALQQQHEKAFADMRAYFNSVVRDNLDAIMALKAELSEQKHKEASTAALLQDVVAENQRLTEPLSKAKKEMGELQKAATQHNREAAALSLVRRRLVEAETQLDRMGFENEVWQQRFELEQKEKESLQQHFNATIAGLQQSAVATAMLLDSSMHASDAPRSSHIGDHGLENSDGDIAAHWMRSSPAARRSHGKLVSGRSSPEPSKQRSFVAEPYGSDQNLMIQGIRQASPGLVI